MKDRVHSQRVSRFLTILSGARETREPRPYALIHSRPSPGGRA